VADINQINTLTLVISGANLVGVVTGLAKIWAWTTSVEKRLAILEERIKQYEGFRNYALGSQQKLNREDK
jgi:hypothetical protein